MYRNMTLGIALLWSSCALAADDAALHYKLGTGDQIRIQVFGEDDLTLELRVGDSGRVSYPFLGDVQVAGLTLAELERAIVDGLKPDYLLDPSVNVSVVEYRPFFIYGEVNKPGGYPFQPGLTVEKAVALAEGFTERASRTRIVVVHDDDPRREKRQAAIGTALRPGDTVTIEQSFF
jgi:polysaccharide export outer membrane protein